MGRRTLNSAKCRCSVCKKEFYNFYKELYVFVVDKKYQCSYSCYLKAKKKKRNKLKEQYGSVPPAIHRTKPNVELTKIRAVENRYGYGCWTRTDDTFLNDPDVVFVRMKRR